MKKILLLSLIALTIFIAAIGNVSAQVPRIFNYQGSLRDAQDRPLNSPVSCTFAIFEQELGGSPIWIEPQQVNVQNGFFNVFLGTVNPLNISFNKPLWLQVTVGNGTPYARTMLATTPFAMKSQYTVTADTSAMALAVIPGGVTQSMLAPGVQALPIGPAGGDLTGTYPNPKISKSAILSNIDPGTITQNLLAPNITFPPSGPASGDLTGTYPDPLIADGAVKTSRIFDGAVTTQKLSDGSVTTAKLASLSVVNGVLAPNAVDSTKIIDGSISLTDLNQSVYNYFLHIGTPAGGDLFGTYANPSVGGFNNVGLNLTPATNGQVYMYNSVTNKWVATSATGDVTGAYNTLTVGKILNVPVLLPTTTGQLYMYNSVTNNWVPSNAAGDVTGPYNALNVGKLQGLVLNGVPTTPGQQYWFNGTQWVPNTFKSVGPLTGNGYNDGVTVTPLKIRDDAAFLPDGPGSVLWFNGAPGVGSWSANKIVPANLNTSNTADATANGFVLTWNNTIGKMQWTVPSATVTTALPIVGNGSAAQPVTLYTAGVGANQVLMFNGANWTNGLVANANLAANSVNTGNIVDGTILDADVNAAAGLQVSKLQTMATGTFIFGNAGVATVGPMSGDATIANNGALTIANGAVNNAKVLLGSLIPNRIQTAATDNQFLTSTIAGGAVWSSFSASAKFTGNGVATPLDIANGAIGNAQLAANSVANANLQANSVATTNIQNSAVTAAKIGAGADNTILSSFGGAASWNAINLAPAFFTGNGVSTAIGIANGAIGTTQLAAASVTNPILAGNAVATANIQDNAVTAQKIGGGAANTFLVSNGVTSSFSLLNLSTTFSGNGVATGLDIAPLAVKTAMLNDGAVTNAKLGTNAVATTNIQDGAVNNLKITSSVAGVPAVSNYVLKADGIGGSFWGNGVLSFPYADTYNGASYMVSLTQQGTGGTFRAIDNGTAGRAGDFQLGNAANNDAAIYGYSASTTVAGTALTVERDATAKGYVAVVNELNAGAVGRGMLIQGNLVPVGYVGPVFEAIAGGVIADDQEALLVVKNTAHSANSAQAAPAIKTYGDIVANSTIAGNVLWAANSVLVGLAGNQVTITPPAVPGGPLNFNSGINVNGNSTITGNLAVTGKVTSASTVGGDGPTTNTTKDYVDALGLLLKTQHYITWSNDVATLPNSKVLANGTATSVNLATPEVDVLFDNSTINVNGSNQLQVKPLGITDAQVSNTAAIAGTKISPNFGSQNIVTTGNLNAAIGTFSGNVTAPNFNGNLVGGTVSGTTGTFTGAVSSPTFTGGTFSGTTGTFSGNVTAPNFLGNLIGGSVSATTGTFSGAVSAPSFVGGTVSGTTGTFSGAVSSPSFVGGTISGTTGTFSGNVTAPNFLGNLIGGSISGTTGTFSGAVSSPSFVGGSFNGTTGTFSGAVNGSTTASFTTSVSSAAFLGGSFNGTTGTFSGAVTGTTANFGTSVTSPSFLGGSFNGTTGTFSGAVTGTTANFGTSVTSPSFLGGSFNGTTGTFSGAVTGTTANFGTSVTSPSFLGGSFNGTTGTFSGAVNGSTTASFTTSVSSAAFIGGSFNGTTGTFSGAVNGSTTASFTTSVSSAAFIGGSFNGTTGTFSGAVNGSTTASFTTSVSSAAFIGGSFNGTTGTFSGLLSANGGLTGTTGTFSGLLTANGGLTGTTGTFSGLLTANGGLSATTGTFTGLITGVNEVLTGNIDVRGQIVNTTGPVVINGALNQLGAANPVNLAGQLNANNGEVVQNGLTVQTGVLSVTAGGINVAGGGVTIQAGGLSVQNGNTNFGTGQLLNVKLANGEKIQLNAGGIYDNSGNIVHITNNNGFAVDNGTTGMTSSTNGTSTLALTNNSNTNTNALQINLSNAANIGTGILVQTAGVNSKAAEFDQTSTTASNAATVFVHSSNPGTNASYLGAAMTLYNDQALAPGGGSDMATALKIMGGRVVLAVADGTGTGNLDGGAGFGGFNVIKINQDIATMPGSAVDGQIIYLVNTDGAFSHTAAGSTIGIGRSMRFIYIGGTWYGE